MQNKRVCVVDLYPQHSMSNHFGVYPEHLKNKPTVYDLLSAVMEDVEGDELNELVHKAIYKTEAIDLIPAMVIVQIVLYTPQYMEQIRLQTKNLLTGLKSIFN